MAGLFMTPSNSFLLVCSLGILLLQQQLDSAEGTMEMSGVVLKRSSTSTSSISSMGSNGRGSSSSSISSSRRSGYVNGVISTRIIDSFNLTKRHNCRDLCNQPHKQSSICPFRCQHRLKESRTEYSDKNRALTKRQTAPSDEQPAKEKSMDDRFTEERPTEKRPAEERPGEEERPAEERPGEEERHAEERPGEEERHAEEEESAEHTKTIAIEAVVRAMKKNTLDAVVSWEWPVSSTDHKPYNFIVHWARVTCNADESFAHCDDPDMYHANTVWSWDSKSNFTLPNVTYNSRYWAEVEYDRVTSHKVWFTTRGCRNPADKYFKRCVDSSPFRSTSSVFRTDKNPLLHINVSCLHFDASSQTGKAFLEWNSDEDLNNGSTRENTILIRYQTPKGPHLEIHHTRVAQFHFDLVPNRIYEIVVKAHDSVKETIYETLNLNISRDHVGQPCSRHDAEAYRVPTLSKESGHLLPSIVIAGVVMIVVILVCLLAVHRCRGIKRKLLKKTLLAKSNSYKSPPGAVPHHAKEEQLQMVMKDEWELNPEHVAIGGEVGQGAFGLVMTGIYQNAQVAIKVLKGEVLPSYKEELLREIALMKRIGKHPNIVSLVGAVTTQEPIALIMEYMPYGNLQTFLQKCRSEGEVRQTEKGMEVDYSPLDELTGTKETWIITSTDMLSFARQIAVAMEFLTDRKYVHRDLAARNVLVGQNKVVKLCDFGLARVVYNGDQYCKLTNGRLPLKWMALESIRDRIFTAQSDVWSYGVLLWEIATLGMTPYPDIAIAELFRHLIEGYRMEQPDNCSAELYAIMSECWCEVPSQRPTFGAIRSQLEALLSQHRNYLDLDCVEPPPTRTGCPVSAASPVDTELLPAVLTRTSRTRPTSGISLDCFSSTGGATAAAAHALTTTSNRMSDAGGSDYRYPREIRSLATSGGREPRTIQDNEDMFVQLLYSN